MGSLAAGQVVFLSFPFSDLSESKVRPVVLLAYVNEDDWIACQSTSNAYRDKKAVELTQNSFAVGGLNGTSYARPGKLFSANESLIRTTGGELHVSALEIVRTAVVAAVYER
jgi:mRNA interferase MazF